MTESTNWEIKERQDEVDWYSVVILMTTNIIALIVGIASTVIGAFLYDFFRSKTRVKVKLVKKSNDRDLEEFVDVYNKLIGENIRIDPTEIIRWVDEDRALRKLKTHSYLHYLFLGKLGGNVVSFLKTMYHKDTHYMFIAYYGIDTSVDRARRLAAPAMMESLAKLIKTELKNCKAVICEVEPLDPNQSETENTQRKARIRLFKETARRMNFAMYEIGVDYWQPQMEIPEDGSFSGERSLLLYAPLDDSIRHNKKISKEKMLDILRFIYLQIYRPTFRHDPEKDISYQVYLNTILQYYEENLPTEIPLKP